MEDFRTKYRPQTIDEVWGNDHIKMIWNGYLTKGYFPRSIILSSNFGMGKTSLARIFAKDIIEHAGEPIFCEEFFEFNSPICDFKRIHEQIRKYEQFIMKPCVLFFDEAHRMPDKAQDGFLTVIENVRSLTFIFATTDMNRIDEGLRSRSDKYQLHPPSREILLAELGKISELEKIRIDKNTLVFLIECSNFSPRECLGNLQILSHYNGIVDINVIKKMLM